MSRQSDVARLIKATNDIMDRQVTETGLLNNAQTETLKIGLLEDIALSLAVIADGYAQAAEVTKDDVDR